MTPKQAMHISGTYITLACAYDEASMPEEAREAQEQCEKWSDYAMALEKSATAGLVHMHQPRDANHRH